jgi:ATP-dependent DNA helicase DinG
MTSATLSVAQDFQFYKKRVGLLASEERLTTTRLNSPFDFQRQAVLGVVSDMPAPDHPDFLAQSAECIGDILAETGGHAFVLFTSFFALNDASKRLEERLRSLRITLLRQGDAARTQLLDRFRADTSSVLFGTDSFWEGVDVAGDALQCVILPRLPFRVPTEPVLQARAESIEAAGGNAFMDYTVPMAVIKFRQGVGRLIRRKTDRGSIIILDSRVISKRYGKKFLDSLPGFRVMTGPKRAVCLALREFHAKRGAS